MADSLRGLEAFDEVKRLIVVAAHPDDLECMCGGTVWKLVQRGVEVYSVNCTLGDIGARERVKSRSALAARRLEETKAAADMLGLCATYSLGQRDGELVPDLALRAEVARLYRLTQADTIFTFDPYWPGQIHPDHRAAGQVAIDAFMPSKMRLYQADQLHGNLRTAQVERIFLFSPGETQIAIDVSDVYDKKMATCKAHESQFPQGEEDLEWLKQMDAENGKLLDVQYAERFKRVGTW